MRVGGGEVVGSGVAMVGGECGGGAGCVMGCVVGG